MPHLNIHMSPEFEHALAEYMRLRGIRAKSDAIRTAVHESLARELRRHQTPDFSAWVGLGRRSPENPNPRFISDDDL